MERSGAQIVSIHIFQWRPGFIRKTHMRRSLFALLVPIALGGCLSISSNPPARNTTVVVPSQPATVCANGTAPPCY
jgi:hypothetical protein